MHPRPVKCTSVLSVSAELGWTFCEPGEFRCNDGVCIPGTLACDGYPNCMYNEDESGCELTLKLKSDKPKLGQEFEIKCEAKGGAELHRNIQWFLHRWNGTKSELLNIENHFPPGGNSPSQPFVIVSWSKHRTYFSDLIIRRVTLELLGFYYCRTARVRSSRYMLKLDKGVTYTSFILIHKFI
ncbi:low-density lipoprotein receptor-related protein [Elysia marginata]|uniref:Low-density lipoprotein receptor-related protein n=1 Tax=Elysia marginata TaxID=1093978 RepID=A0AAV4JKS6_9GAST|nr:low-density lipoprotein receptor-related protein [Elysia marginata]